MAYDCSKRFPPTPHPYVLLDPGSYQNDLAKPFKQNKCGFNSCTPRVTFLSRIYADVVYNTEIPRKIPNITGLKSKTPRFQHKDFKIQEFEEILCDCDKVCDCTDSILEVKQKLEEVCQGKLRKRLIVGNPPRQKHISSENFETGKSSADTGGPPFYDARLDESTKQYHGWKWSQRTSKRSPDKIQKTPGPADYTLERNSSPDKLCLEHLRSFNRRYSRQLRFMDMVHQKNIRENIPSPAHYSPYLPGFKSTTSNFPKASRFSEAVSQHEKKPGPADHGVKRLFDPPSIKIRKKSGFKRAEPSFFGCKAPRFNPAKGGGPGPANYWSDYRGPKISDCFEVPFGTSALRWKDAAIPTEEDYNDDSDSQNKENDESKVEKSCADPQWMFKSTTRRLKSYRKRFDEPSPADFPMKSPQPPRKSHLQYVAPFDTSEGRFQPWHDWLPFQDSSVTPGIGYYDPKWPKCIPAVVTGPLFREPRFKMQISYTPAPNEYETGKGLLKTFNKRLQKNIDSRIQDKYVPPAEPKKPLNPEEKINLLFDQSIKLCVTEELEALGTKQFIVFTDKAKIKKSDVKEYESKCKLDCCQPCNTNPSNKLLRSFLYKQELPRYF